MKNQVSQFEKKFTDPFGSRSETKPSICILKRILEKYMDPYGYGYGHCPKALPSWRWTTGGTPRRRPGAWTEPGLPVQGRNLRPRKRKRVGSGSGRILNFFRVRIRNCNFGSGLEKDPE